ncbi:MAG: alpha/beta hydrolase [Pyrinomonadaceae bacterium]
MVTRLRLWRVTKWIAFGIVAAIVSGALYQLVTTRLDDGKYLPPGQIVDVKGHKMHINCTGNGATTVILESGLAGGSLDWSLVQPEVAKFGRVCSYDRAGIVWSAASDRRRDAAQITSELHDLLDAANISPPYVIVGHSIGGVYVQLFAARYPDEVAGVVLVDSSHQDQLATVAGIPSFVPYLFKAAAPVGIARIVNSLEDFPNLSSEAKAERAGLYSHTQTVFAIANEMAAVSESLAQLRSSPMQLGDKPLIVLSRGLSDGASPETEAAWRSLQTEMVKSSSNGKQVIAEKSGHYIQVSEPELVTVAIHDVIRAAAEKP